MLFFISLMNFYGQERKSYIELPLGSVLAHNVNKSRWTSASLSGKILLPRDFVSLESRPKIQKKGVRESINSPTEAGLYLEDLRNINNKKD